MEQQLGFRSSSWLCFALGLLFPFLALVAVAGQEDALGTLLFVEADSGRHFLQTGDSISNSDTAVFSYSDVTTSVAVLLGVFPPVDVSQSSALKVCSPAKLQL
jgi:hypothetical protein